MNFNLEITEYIKAGFPLYYIYTQDENSVVEELESISKILKLEVKGWKINSSPLDSFISSIPQNTIGYCINPHFILEQPDLIQTIKDNSNILKEKNSKVFFICNSNKYPPELSRNFVFFSFDLPDKNAINRRLDIILNSVREQLSITLSNIERENVIQSALGLTAEQAEDAFSLSIIRDRDIKVKTIIEIKAKEYLKSGIMELETPKSIESFQGYKALKDYIFEIKDSFFKPSRFNLPSPKGILLIGPPGTGKTLASKCIASIFNLMLLKADLSKLFTEFVGGTERNTRLLISSAEAMAPIVLRIDEIEKQMSGMGSSGNLDSGVTNRSFGSLLQWMSDRTKPVFMIATANNVQNLPPELMRKGRWDEIFFIDLPNKEEIVNILAYHIKSRFSEFNFFLLDGIENSLQGWTGAEIEQLVIHTLRKYENYCIAENPEGDFTQDNLSYPILESILEEEIQKTTPLSIIRKSDIDKLRNWAVQNNVRLASSNANVENAQKEFKRKFTFN